MRKFYQSWNLLKFDDCFVKKTEEYDLIIIGGGNFFDLCHTYSKTGTTIDIGEKILEQIKCPIFFNTLGFDIYNGVTSELIQKFKKFINYLLERPQKYFVSFRNDGSKDNFQKIYGYFDERIKIIPDGGFFFEKENIFKKEKYIGINLAMDMLEKRFKNMSYEAFCEKLSRIYLEFLKNNQEYKLLFFPHIITDYTIILNVINKFDDYTKRTKVEICPYLTGQGKEKEYLKYYSKCQVISGMRFHSNIIAVSLNIPVIPIVNYPQILNLYKELEEEKKIVEVKDNNFEEKYYNKLISEIKINGKGNNEKLLLKLKEMQEKEYLNLKKWLNSNKIY